MRYQLAGCRIYVIYCFNNTFCFRFLINYTYFYSEIENRNDMKHKKLNLISKRKYLLRIFVCFVILFISMLNKSGYAQNCLDSIRHNPLYSNSNNIFNGIKWIYEKKYLGSPLLVENYWPKGSIFYKGVQYSDVFMNYDLYKNQAIVFLSLIHI